MIQFTNCYSYLAANIVQLRIYAMQLERLAELLKGSAPNVFCNNLCLPISLSGTLYHCTQKNKPSTYICTQNSLTPQHWPVEEGRGGWRRRQQGRARPHSANVLQPACQFFHLVNFSIIKYQHRPPPSERFGKVLMMVPLLVSAFTFLVNLSLLLKLATRPSSPISLTPPLTCRKFQTLGRRAAGGGFDFLDSKPRLVGAKYWRGGDTGSGDKDDFAKLLPAFWWLLVANKKKS